MLQGLRQSVCYCIFFSSFDSSVFSHSYNAFLLFLVPLNDPSIVVIMSVHQQLVLDWLLDFKKLDKSSHGDVHAYCIRVESDSATASALFKLLEDQKSHEDVSYITLKFAN